MGTENSSGSCVLVPFGNSDQSIYNPPNSGIRFKNRKISQFPSLGVQTKNQKHALTFLLDIPELWEVIQSWDEEVRSICPLESPWFARISPETRKIDSYGFRHSGKHCDCRARKDIMRWLEKVNLPYHSPHKFRHGHAVYGLKNSRDIRDLKAISQNLMHSNLSITDGVYGILSANDMQERIEKLGKGHDVINHSSKEEIIQQVVDLISNL